MTTTLSTPNQKNIPVFTELTEAEFDAKYTVVVPKDVNGYEDDTVSPSDEGLDRDSKHLWTIIDGDNGNLYAVTGWAKVNAIGYILTEEAWAGEIEAEWMIFNDDATEDENDDEPGDFDNE